MARSTPRAVFGAATAATHVLGEIAAEGWPVAPSVLEALEQVRRFTRRDGVTAATCKRLAKQLWDESLLSRQWTVGSTKQRYFWAVSSAGNIALLAATGGSLDETLEHLTYGLVDRKERVAGWVREAERAATDVPLEPPPAKKVPAATLAVQAKALARMAKALGTRGRLVKSKRARHEARLTADAAKLKALLARHRYPAHASVLAFERTFGGLVIPDTGDDDMETIVGAFACLRSKAHVRPDGGRTGLVPVAYTANDGILFLDAKGTPYYQDTLEDVAAIALETNAAGAVAKLLQMA